MPCVTPWECVLALPSLALDKGWREEVKKNLELTKGLGLAWEVFFWQQLPQNLHSCDGGFVAGSFFAVQVLLPRAEKLQMRIVTEGVKLSCPVGLVPCNYSPYSPLYSLDSY